MILTVDTEKESVEGLRRAAKLLEDVATAKDGGDLAQEIAQVEEVAEVMTQSPKPVPQPAEPKKPSIYSGVHVY